MASRITRLFVKTNFEVKYLTQHIGYQNNYRRGKRSKIRILLQITKIYFLLKISQITPIAIEQVFLCLKMGLKSLSLKNVLKLLKYLNSVDKIMCLNVIRSACMFSAYGYQLQ